MEEINKKITNCKKCSRLVHFREKIALEKRKQFQKEVYWGKPVPGFGDKKAEILILVLITDKKFLLVALELPFLDFPLVF